MFPEERLEMMISPVSDIKGPDAPRWMRDMILYSIYVRNFSKSGDFNGVIKRLDEIKALGATAIWLIPIHPIGKKAKKGSLGCPYSITDYFEINPEYGTKADFKHLVDETHKRGMKIFIDAVLNHAAHDHVKVTSRPHWFRRDKYGVFTRRRTEWSDVIDVDFECKQLWDYLGGVMKYWVEEFDVDGFRCDVAGMAPIEFWEKYTKELRRIKPDLYMLAEWDWSPHLCRRAFNSDYRGDHYRLMKRINDGETPAQSLVETADENYQKYPQNYLPMNFIENHDQQRASDVFGKTGFKPWAAFIFTIPGVPLIYNGQEIGATKYLSLFEKMPVNWENKDDDTYNFYRMLIDLRNQRKAARDGRFTPLKSDKPQKIASYAVIGRSEKIICVLNLSYENTGVKIDVKTNNLKPGHFHISSGGIDDFTVKEGKLSINIPAKGFAVIDG